MTSPWSGTSAWVNGSAIGATDVNDYINNNIDHLKSPPLSIVVTAIPTPASTTATTAVPVTAGISATVTTYGAPVQAYFKMRTLNSGGGFNLFNLDIDGTAYTTYVSGLARSNNTYDGHYHVWITGLASGSHVFIPTWRVSVGTGYTQASGEPINFWVREG